MVFSSWASDLVASDNNGTSDVFVHDRQTVETTRVSVAYNGAEADGQSSWFSISSDGRYVAFASWAPNLVLGDTNGNRNGSWGKYVKNNGFRKYHRNIRRDW